MRRAVPNAALPNRLAGADPAAVEATMIEDMLRLLVLLALLPTAVLAQGVPVTPADQAAGQAWWSQVQVLADDNMQGRLTGSEAYMRAAKYVTSQFDAARLQPAGTNGWYQPVKFDVTRVLPA